MSVPLSETCSHYPSENSRGKGTCGKCGRKILPLPHVTVGEASELWMLLNNNPRPWNRRIRRVLERSLELPASDFGR